MSDSRLEFPALFPYMLFYSFKNYLKDKFPGLNVYKIPLDAGFSCPHRSADTKTGRHDSEHRLSGGCIYCDNSSFSPYAKFSPRLPIKEQVAKAMEFYRQRHKADKFIIYFQAYTNTLGPEDKLKALYDEALTHPDIIGLSIGTRPDCVPDKTLDLISGYAKQYDVWLEYGLQSTHDRTLKFINRGHKYADFKDAVRRTKGRGISIAAHLILGLPGETKDDMLNSVQKTAGLGIKGIKLHHLYITRNTPIAELYSQGKIKLFSLSEYIPLVCDAIELIPPEMVIIRVMGELNGIELIAPKWHNRKSQIIQLIEKELATRNSAQGRRYRLTK